jgi:hypothetical protein
MQNFDVYEEVSGFCRVSPYVETLLTAQQTLCQHARLMADLAYP